MNSSTCPPHFSRTWTYKMSKLTNVIAGVDGCHFPFGQKPQGIPAGRTHIDFINRKEAYSINAQIVGGFDRRMNIWYFVPSPWIFSWCCNLGTVWCFVPYRISLQIYTWRQRLSPIRVSYDTIFWAGSQSGWHESLV